MSSHFLRSWLVVPAHRPADIAQAATAGADVVVHTDPAARSDESLVERAFDAALESQGVFFLFTLRLVPYVPFFVVNLVMGLTRMRVRTFWWVSQLGMLAGTPPDHC